MQFGSLKQKFSPVMAIINDRINDVSTMNRAQFEECQYPRSASIGYVGGWDT